MPYRAWKHTCPESSGVSQPGSPVCDRCGKAKEPDGWRFGMHESMGQYQSLYGLKPVGPHRRMADELFRGLTVNCEACAGGGVFDDPPSWKRCRRCRGLGRLFTVPREMVESLRTRVLEEFPDAAARAIPDFPGGPMVRDLARGEVITPKMAEEELNPEHEDRLEESWPDSEHTHLETGPDDPWRHLTTEQLTAVLEARLESDASAGEWADRVWRPRHELLLGDAVVETMPDEASRRRAREDVEAEYLHAADVAALLPEMEDRGWVVKCEVTSSMVSGSWGLSAFTLGDRGYVYEVPDFGVDAPSSPKIVGVWDGASDAEARRACILSVWVRIWKHIGLPPMVGEWVDGEPNLLCAALLRVLETEEGRRYWGDVVGHAREARLRDCTGRSMTAVGHIFGLDMRAVARVLKQIEDPTSDIRERLVAGTAAESDRTALAALFLWCIMPRLRPLLDGRAEPRGLGAAKQMVG